MIYSKKPHNTKHRSTHMTAEYVPIPLSAPTDIREFWISRAKKGLGSNHLLNNLLSRWDQWYPLEEERIPLADPFPWDDGQLENQLNPEEVTEAEEALTAGATRILSKASHEQLIRITTFNGKARELTWEEVLDQIQATHEPMARVSLVEQPVVSTWTQIGFLVSWWIQNPQPEGLPRPPWVSEMWSDPDWDPTNPPMPTWLRTWITQWKKRSQRQEVTPGRN